MSDLEHDSPTRFTHLTTTEKQPLVIRVTDSDFQSEVLERLGRLETKMDMLAGSDQPGRVTLLENRIMTLERNDIRRSVYDRMVNAAISMAVSIAIALHDHLGIK
ncbi:MAG TPA: hypothetical protein VLK33_01225 [Terriglobales bacterium]|nr:hypothetical protein [Terriglobales bacterium]